MAISQQQKSKEGMTGGDCSSAILIHPGGAGNLLFHPREEPIPPFLCHKSLTAARSGRYGNVLLEKNMTPERCHKAIRR